MTTAHSIREDEKEEALAVTKGGVVLVNPVAAVKLLKSNGTLDLLKSRKKVLFRLTRIKKAKLGKKHIAADFDVSLVGQKKEK